MSYNVTFQPQGQTGRVAKGKNLLQAAQEAKIAIDNHCGGRGRCGKCRVKVLSGYLPAPGPSDIRHLEEGELDDGWRLACQFVVEGDLEVFLPPSTLTQEQRLQVEGRAPVLQPDPPVRKFRLDTSLLKIGVSAALIDDIETRLRKRYKLSIDKVELYPLMKLADIARGETSSLEVVLRGGSLVDVFDEQWRGDIEGLAVDLGSTKIALFMMDVTRGETVESLGLMNPQISFGEDIISRLQYSLQGKGNRARLQREVVNSINVNLKLILNKPGVKSKDIFEILLVGNTAMHHLLLGLPVNSLAYSPYVPVVNRWMELPARDLGLKVHPEARLVLPPPIAGFVGSDHLAVLLATRIWEEEGPCMVMDIGTNTEVSLKVDGRIYCCSCASGPAFEGAGISWGMRAAEGAIDWVDIDVDSGEIFFSVIGESQPRGICGSGILDAISSMIRAGILDERGRMREGHPRVSKSEKGLAFRLASAAEQGSWVEVTQSDVQEIQKAKGAMRTGIDILLHHAGIRYDQLRKFIIAGAFGSYLDLVSAREIAMIPPLPLERVEQVGNAAGVGAREMLCSLELRRRAEELKKKIEHVELVSYPKMDLVFASSMLLSQEAVNRYRTKFNLDLC